LSVKKTRFLVGAFEKWSIRRMEYWRNGVMEKWRKNQNTGKNKAGPARMVPEREPS
jgi:hypothetical protein